MYLQKRSHDNYMALNPGKCYYMTFGLNTIKNEFSKNEVYSKNNIVKMNLSLKMAQFLLQKSM